jgi:predicted PurR-regulated permease PerM
VYASLTVAFILAYLLDPVVGWAEKRKVPREVAAPLCLVIFLSAIVLLGVAIVPKIASQGRELVHRLPQLYYGLASRIGPVSERYVGYNVFRDVDKLVAEFGDPTTLASPIGGLVQGVFRQTILVVTRILGLLIIPLLAYYLLRDFPHLYDKLLYVVPKRHHKTITEIRRRLDSVLGGFLRGQLLVSTILATYYAVAFTALRLDLSLLLGLMAGFFNVVPYVGIISVLLLTMLIALIHGAGAGTFVGIAVIYAIGMGCEGSFITPRIVGRKVGLSPLTLILALLVGGELLGLTGMLIAVPFAAIGKVFIDYFLEHYRESESFMRT